MYQPCICSEAGYCERYKTRMIGRPFQICQHQYAADLPTLTLSQREAFLRHKEKEVDKPFTISLNSDTRSKPCIYRGETLRDEKGKAITRECALG